MQTPVKHDPEAAALSRCYALLLKLSAERREKDRTAVPKKSKTASGPAGGKQK